MAGNGKAAMASPTVGGWTARFENRPAWAFDVAVAVILALQGIPSAIFHQQRVAAGIVLTVALILPLTVRRRFPVAVFCVIAAVAFVQWTFDLKLSADIALLVALYTVAATQAWRLIIAAVVVMEIGVALAVARWSSDNWMAAIFLTGMVTAATALAFYFRTRRAYLGQLRERAAQLEIERDQQGALAAAAERARIAREMHDIVAHHLTVMVALSDGALASAESAPERSQAAMRSVGAVGRQALTDTRRLLGVLRENDEPEAREPQPDLGRIDALITQVRDAGLQTELVIRGKPQVAPAALELTIYRLIQEALTNTLKHAGPDARARVQLTYSATDLELVVTDDGHAGQPRSPRTTAGHGLAGMTERVQTWGGELEAGPQQWGGWKVTARVRLDAPEGSAKLPTPIG